MKISHTLEIFSENCWSVLLEKKKENMTNLRRNNHFISPPWLTPEDSPCQQIWKCRTGSSIESDLNQICRACITSARINFCSNSGTSVTILWGYNVHKINKHCSFRWSTLLPYYVTQVGSTPKYLGTKPARGTARKFLVEIKHLRFRNGSRQGNRKNINIWQCFSYYCHLRTTMLRKIWRVTWCT